MSAPARCCRECGAGKVVSRELCTACYARWRRNQPGRCRYCGGVLGPDDNGTHSRCLERRRDIWGGYRDTIIDAYGARCACCGETERLFLSIDHVNGGGTQHRRSLGGGNRRMMLSIIRDNFPSEFQILCFNCNLGRSRNNGVCPHEYVLELSA